MTRRKLIAALPALALTSAPSLGLAQDELTIDATKQPSPPVRGRGPFPGSSSPGHSPGLLVQIGLGIPTGELRPDGTTLVDFVLRNVGSEGIALPTSIDQNLDRTDVLTLWLTSDGIRPVYFRDQQTNRLVKFEAVGTSAELYGDRNDRRTFHLLAPGAAIRVHASSRVALNPGLRSFAAHAELLQIAHSGASIQSILLGNSDGAPITRMLSPFQAR